MITAITPKQEARFAEWRDKWIKIGLSTEPADFEKAEKAALRAYALCGFENPKVILRMGSPYGATVGGAMECLMLHRISPDNGLSIKQQIGYQVGHKIGQQIGQQIGLQVQQKVGQQVEWQVWKQVQQRIGFQVRQKICKQTVPDIVMEGLANNRSGAFWAWWCAYVTFLRDVLGWRDPSLENFSIEEDLTTCCGLVWWHNKVLAISDRPSEIHLDAEGRLHNESGPSIAYRDGWKLYHIHGVAIPDFVIERPDKITVAYIEKERNAEVRRVLIERMGLERFVHESGLKPVHSDNFGTLYRREMPDDEPLVMVKVVNSTPNPDGSRKEYFLRVPPTMRRAREAVAWTFGMEEKEYRPVTET